jgi:hypothetical protein
MRSIYLGPRSSWWEIDEHLRQSGVVERRRDQPQQRRDHAPHNPVRFRIAHHEAAHAVAFGHNDVEVDHIRVDGNSGICHTRGAAKDTFAQIVSLLAGEATEKRFFGVEPDDESTDRRRARQLASVMELEDRGHWVDIMRQAWSAALRFVEDHERAIRAVGEELYERGKLSGLFVAGMVNGLPQVATRPIAYRPAALRTIEYRVDEAPVFRDFVRMDGYFL